MKTQIVNLRNGYARKVVKADKSRDATLWKQAYQRDPPAQDTKVFRNCARTMSPNSVGVNRLTKYGSLDQLQAVQPIPRASK